MSYNSAELWDLIVSLVAAPGRITPRMQVLIDYCAAVIPHEHWTKLRGIDYDAETSNYSGWLTDLVAGADDEAPRGVWFGLVNPVRAGNVTLDMYGATSTEFDPGNLDWTVSINRSSVRFVRSQVLAALYSYAYDAVNPLENDAEYPLGLGYGAMTARMILEAGPVTEPFDQTLGAAVGFDSGDYLYLGEARAGRFRANVRGG